MQSVNTRRLSPAPHATIIAIAIGLAVLAGIVALAATDNVPGRGDSVSEAVSAPVVISESAGEGLVSPRHLETIVGGGVMLDTANPIIRGEPSFGQGEGLVGPGALTDLAAAPALTFEQMRFLEENGVFATESTVAPALTLDQMRFLEENGALLSELAPIDAGTVNSIVTTDRMRFLELNGVFAIEADPTMDQYIAGPHNEGYTDESSPSGTEYVADPYLAGPNE